MLNFYRKEEVQVNLENFARDTKFRKGYEILKLRNLATPAKFGKAPAKIRSSKTFVGISLDLYDLRIFEKIIIYI